MITGIILASGFSNRMGRDKLLIKLKDETLIETVIKACKESELDKLLLVYRQKEVKDIGEKYNLETILNSNANLGQSESIKLGVAGVKMDSDFMFIMGDQPFIDKEHINKLINKYNNSEKGILVPYYNSKRGMPSIFGGKYRDELLRVQGDKGGRDLMKKHKEDLEEFHFQDEKLGKDIDTPEDLEVVKKWV
nr:nucleotidyltransferase family protein [Tissierella sp.]